MNAHFANIFWRLLQIPTFCLLPSKIRISNSSPLQGRRANRLPCCWSISQILIFANFYRLNIYMLKLFIFVASIPKFQWQNCHVPRARGTAWSRCRARLQRPGRPCHDLGSAADGAAIGRAVLGQAPVPWREKSPLKKWGFRIFGQERMGIQDAQGLKKNKEDMGPVPARVWKTIFPLEIAWHCPFQGPLCVPRRKSHIPRQWKVHTRNALFLQTCTSWRPRLIIFDYRGQFVFRQQQL